MDSSVDGTLWIFYCGFFIVDFFKKVDMVCWIRRRGYFREDILVVYSCFDFFR